MDSNRSLSASIVASADESLRPRSDEDAPCARAGRRSCTLGPARRTRCAARASERVTVPGRISAEYAGSRRLERDGEVACLVSEEEHRRPSNERPSLVEFLMNGPDRSGVDRERDRTHMRDVDGWRARDSSLRSRAQESLAAATAKAYPTRVRVGME